MSKILKTAGSDWFRQRLIGAVFCVMAAFALLVIRLFYLQVVGGKEYRKLSENQCIRLQSIDAPRGLIMDRNKKLLVDNRPSFDLNIVLKNAGDVDATIDKLAEYTGLQTKSLMSKIARANRIPMFRPILLKEDMARDTLAAVEVHQYDLPGIVINVRSKRHYNYKKSASHLIGYLGEISPKEFKSGKYPESRVGDFVGKFGVEKVCNSDLTGKRGRRLVEVNAMGRVVRVLETNDAQPGHNVYLTIDIGLQKKAEELLKGKTGAAVAMDPDTGHILAMASNPAFDPNAFVSGMSHKEWNELISSPFRPMENKALKGQYPPGSTYKIVSAIAGLEEGVVDENTTFYCPGFYKYGDRTFRCWKRGGHGSTAMVKALAESCDVYFYQVGQKLGVDRLSRYAKLCGLGSRTGMDLDHEASGLVPSTKWKKKRFGVPWQSGETLSVVIGQGYNLATPLQILVLTSAVANGGTLYRPLIVDRIETADGEVVRQRKPRQVINRLPVSPETIDIIKKGLWEVVNGKGTARIARLDDIEVSGKTGTAQVVSRKKNTDPDEKNRPDHLKPHAWFVSYAYNGKSGIAVSVIVEHGEHGSTTAAPIAREITRHYLQPKKKGRSG